MSVGSTTPPAVTTTVIQSYRIPNSVRWTVGILLIVLLLQGWLQHSMGIPVNFVRLAVTGLFICLIVGGAMLLMLSANSGQGAWGGFEATAAIILFGLASWMIFHQLPPNLRNQVEEILAPMGGNGRLPDGPTVTPSPPPLTPAANAGDQMLDPVLVQALTIARDGGVAFNPTDYVHVHFTLRPNQLRSPVIINQGAKGEIWIGTDTTNPDQSVNYSGITTEITEF